MRKPEPHSHRSPSPAFCRVNLSPAQQSAMRLHIQIGARIGDLRREKQSGIAFADYEGASHFLAKINEEQPLAPNPAQRYQLEALKQTLNDAIAAAAAGRAARKEPHD